MNNKNNFLSDIDSRFGTSWAKKLVFNEIRSSPGARILAITHVDEGFQPTRVYFIEPENIPQYEIHASIDFNEHQVPTIDLRKGDKTTHVVCLKYIG